METKRQLKVAKQIQKDLGEIFVKEMSDQLRGVITTVTKVMMSPDLSYAKVYVSVFPFTKSNEVMDILAAEEWKIRKTLGAMIRNQLRIVPELAFFHDDSLEQAENITNLLK